MNENNWYDTFIETIYEKFPKKKQVTTELMDLLFLEREAVYRRLRKEVPFTAYEIVQIASEWNISLDAIMGIQTGNISFTMSPLDYVNPSKKDIKDLQKKVDLLEHILTTPNTEYFGVCNKLPRPITIGFLTLYRFKIFNWACQYNDEEEYRSFNRIIIPDQMIRKFIHLEQIMKHVTTSHFILDQKIFENVVTSILYFHSILLITDEEKAQIKQDLKDMLAYMLEIANTGCYPETQNKVNLYISQIHLDSSYSYFNTEKLKLSRIHAFGKFDINTLNEEMNTLFRTWMNQKKRTSIQISEVNEKSRIEYFTEQMRIVETL